MSADLNSGVSRTSGRVRKKTVKLIEMEDLPPIESTSSGNNVTNNGKKSPAPAKLKIVIGGKEVVREVVPVKTSLFLNDSDKVKTLAPIKFRLNTSSVTHTLEESPVTPPSVKKVKLDVDKVKTTPSPTIVTVKPPQITPPPVKGKPVTVNVNSASKQAMTPKLKSTPVTSTPKNSAKSKGVTKSANAKNSTPKVKTEKRRHITAYTLWSRENRSIIQQDHPELDFAGVSKRMGEVWQHLSNSEKYIWKMRAHKELAAITPVPSSTRPVSKPSSSSTKSKKGSKKNSSKAAEAPSPSTLCNPLRMAAHLKLIGESLEAIGKQLSDRKNGDKVSARQLSQLLDCTVSSLGPLLALTTLDSRLDGCPLEIHRKILDNISYIMPNI